MCPPGPSIVTVLPPNCVTPPIICDPAALLALISPFVEKTPSVLSATLCNVDDWSIVNTFPPGP